MTAIDNMGSNLRLDDYWTVQCFGPDGKLKWSDTFENLVVTVGKNDLLQKYLTGSSYTAAFSVGLTGTTPTFASGDTMASHSGWTEVVAYSQSTRVAYTAGTASAGSIDNSGSVAVFSINANGTTLGGAFLCTNSTKSGTSGTLFGGAAFSSGDKVLGSGDTLNVTITCSV